MKYLHTMVRVTDLDASLDFYCNKLGLVEVSRSENPGGRFTLVFLCAPADREAAVITFAATASGVALWGVGSAFWGLAAGFAALVAARIARKG